MGALCFVCGERPPFRRGRCNRCSKWWRKYGSERPTDVDDRRWLRKPKRLCSVCAERFVHARGRCHRCWDYHYRTGIEWTAKPPPPRGAERHNWKGDAATDDSKRYRANRRYRLRDCERCGAPGVLRHHKDEDVGNNEPENIEVLCKRCHQRHHMGLPPRPCAHCSDLSKKLKRGRCNVCYQYLRVNGVDRPPTLVAKTAARRAVVQGGDLEVGAATRQAALEAS